MSHQATSWAYRQEINSSGVKFVLVALADFADEAWSCYPGQDRLAKMTGQSVSSVGRHLKWLEANGYLTRQRRSTTGGHRTSDRYVLSGSDVPTGQIANKANCQQGKSPTSQPVPPTGQIDVRLPVNLPEEPSVEPSEEPSGKKRPVAAPRLVQEKKSNAPAHQLVTQRIYDRVNGAITFKAVMGIAKWALEHHSEEAVEEAAVSLYEMGKPILKQTMGQYLSGHIRKPQDGMWSGCTTRPDAPRDPKSGLLVER